MLKKLLFILICVPIVLVSGCAQPDGQGTNKTMQAQNGAGRPYFSNIAQTTEIPAVSVPATPAPIVDNAPRVEIPISQTVFEGGDVRYSIPVTIGAQTFDAMLDTGSTGLRILQVAQKFSYTDTKIPSNYAYGSGVQLTGTIGKATVTVGGISTAAPIPVEIVQSISCVKDKPDCPASNVSQSDYRIGSGGEKNKGFEAIIGVNLGLATAVNPLTQIANSAWIIELPKPGQSAPGKLIINPTVDEMAAYTMFDLASLPAGGWGDSLPGCIFNDTTGDSVCEKTLIDTGEVGFRATSDRYPLKTQWKNGAAARLTFQNASGLSVEFPFTVGKGMTNVVINASANEVKDLNTGMYPLLNLSALYDFADGKIGLKKI
jgi:predicted aspartyl protease